MPSRNLIMHVTGIGTLRRIICLMYLSLKCNSIIWLNGGWINIRCFYQKTVYPETATFYANTAHVDLLLTIY